METPKVGIVIGSESDLPMMEKAAEVLKEWEIDYELTIVSAHRTPDRMREYATTAKERGLKVIIAGAGGAAHLPGMLASWTTLPVIGVPVKASISLEGVDSMLSIVQMPPGIPVATVGVDNAQNAGLLAARILGTSNESIAAKLEEYRDTTLTEKVDGMIENVKGKHPNNFDD